MLSNYLNRGISYLLFRMPLAFIIFLAYFTIKSLIKKRIEIKLMYIIGEFLWILIVLTILGITGVLGGDFSVTSIGNMHFSFGILEEGISMATILNVVLFIPFGILSALNFKKLRDKKIYGILIGLIFTITIEFLQSFTGRFVQLEDILMNTIGTYIGYTLFIYFLKSNRYIDVSY